MRRLFFFAVIMLLYPTLPVSADSLSCDVGTGFYYSTGNTAYFLRYQYETKSLYVFSTYFEASYGSWSGPDHTEAFGLAWGIHLARTRYDYLTLTGGLSYINRTTSNLGQPFEFYGRAAYGINVGEVLFSIGVVHYSSGKYIFGLSGPNYGENFVTLSIGMRF